MMRKSWWHAALAAGILGGLSCAVLVAVYRFPVRDILKSRLIQGSARSIEAPAAQEFGTIIPEPPQASSKDTEGNSASASALAGIFEQPQAPVTLIAVGDIMLGRHVETLMRQKGFGYPFEQIASFLKNADITLGNLEGPVTRRHIPTLTGSMRFSFLQNVPELLGENGFDVLSLANNHTFDYGNKGFTETREYVRKAGLDAIGHPREASEEYVITKEFQGEKFTFLALNAIQSSFDEKEALVLVEQFARDPEPFVIVTIHWGSEYQLRANAAQERLARAFVDAGADAVIGHHPHVVQNVELYRGKAIFYSLGNFVFDQYFSRDTQEGLAISVEIGPEEVVYHLHPVDISKSQPALMPHEKSKPWLSRLAARSSADISEQIREGIVKAARELPQAFD